MKFKIDENLDLDFSNILTYPPAKYPGIVVCRLPNPAHVTVETAVCRDSVGGINSVRKAEHAL